MVLQGSVLARLISRALSRVGVLSVPPSVKVTKGWSNASFTIVTKEVSMTQVVELTATYQGVTRRFSITVYPQG